MNNKTTAETDIPQKTVYMIILVLGEADWASILITWKI
jgi:hypothetical protein